MLKKLEQAGFLARSEQQRRRRRLMTVTEKGEYFLDASWHECQDDYGDVESVLRAATVGILMGDVQRRCRRRKTCPPWEWYQSVRWHWESSRRTSAASVFREIAKELEETKRS